MPGPIDLRSDTVTLPTPAMREAMYRAELGDDVYGEDPTVCRLEQLAAEKMGKEAAVLVASGTMGNLVALLSHCGRGVEAIVGDQSHSFLAEVGGASALGGIPLHPVPTGRLGMLEPAALEAAIRPGNLHYPPTGLICVENTHNYAGGTALCPAQLGRIRAVADAHGLPVHMDGARVFNAAVALGVDVRELAEQATTVQFCLSKGLAAPVGCVLVGPRDFIGRARKHRKMVGGGMRQAGVLAAAGIVALTEMVDRLAEDHRHARRLAEAVAELPGCTVDLETVQTNIVMVDLAGGAGAAAAVQRGLAAEGVLVSSPGGSRLRAVTHYGLDAGQIETAIAAFRRTVPTGAATSAG